MNNPNMSGGFNSYGNQGQGYGNPQNMRLHSNIPTPTFLNMMPQTEYQARMSVYNMPPQEFVDASINRSRTGVEQGNIYHARQVDGISQRVVENIPPYMENRSAQAPGFIPPFNTQVPVINPVNPQIPNINPHINPQMSHHLHHINPQMNPSYTQPHFGTSPSLSQREVYIPETIPAFETHRPTINNSFMHNQVPVPANFASTNQAYAVSVQQDQYNICCKCRNPTANLISLNCPDKWCIDCLKRVCIENSFQYALIECVCRARMRREYFINIFGGEYQLYQLENDFYTRLNDQFKPEPSSNPAHPIPSYSQASNLYSQPSMPNHLPTSNLYSQPSMAHQPPESSLYSQPSMAHQPPASYSYTQPSIPSHSPGSNSYSLPSAQLNSSRYQPSIPSSNSIPSLYSEYQQNEYLARFICDYCKNSISDESYRITLDCDHKICKTCLNTHITLQRSNYIHPTCKFDDTQISHDIISANLFPFLQTIEAFRQYLPPTN